MILNCDAECTLILFLCRVLSRLLARRAEAEAATEEVDIETIKIRRRPLARRADEIAEAEVAMG